MWPISGVIYNQQNNDLLQAWSGSLSVLSGKSWFDLIVYQSRWDRKCFSIVKNVQKNVFATTAKFFMRVKLPRYQ